MWLDGGQMENKAITGMENKHEFRNQDSCGLSLNSVTNFDMSAHIFYPQFHQLLTATAD